MIGPLWEGATNNNNVEPPSFGGATSSFYDVDAVLIRPQVSQRIQPFYFLNFCLTHVNKDKFIFAKLFFS